VENRIGLVATFATSPNAGIQVSVKSGNVALASNGTTVTGPIHKPESLLDGKAVSGDGNTYAAGNWPCEWYITFDKIYRLREIRMLLHDVSNQVYYQYVIETSVDGKTFAPLVDRSKGEWRSWQHIPFPPRPVKLIKLTGKFNSGNPFFHVVELEAYCLAPAAPRK